MKKIILIILSIMIIGCSMQEPKTQVYLCFGQSNAKKAWADGIGSIIHEYDSEAIIVHANHGGAPISMWYNDEPGDLYYSDLEVVLSAVDGIDYEIAGLFWMQGESDRNITSYPYYKDRFYGFINQLYADLEISNMDIIIHYVWSPDEDLTMIRSVLNEIVLDSNNIYGFETSGYRRLDSYHLPADLYPVMGTDAAEFYLGELH